MAVVLPEKSALATTSGLHSGWARIITSGNCWRTESMSSGVNSSCTSQRPFQAIMVRSTSVLDLRRHPAFGSTDGTITWQPVSRATLLREVLVGQEDHRVGLERLDHRHRVARGAADVALGLHVGVGVDVGDDRHARVGRAQRAHVRGGDALGERAAALRGRQQHGLRRVQDLGGLGHEAHAAEHDHRLVGLGRAAGQLERVALEVGHGVEQRRLHVVVAEDHGVALDLEAQHLCGDLGLEEHLGLGHHVPELALEVLVDGFGLHARGSWSGIRLDGVTGAIL